MLVAWLEQAADDPLESEQSLAPARLRGMGQALGVSPLGLPIRGSPGSVWPLCSAFAARPRRGAASTSQGRPNSIFKRALQRRNVVAAEAELRRFSCCGHEDALELTLLVARKDPCTPAQALAPTHWLRSGQGPAHEERWQAHLGCDEHLDEPAEVVVYCPDCAEREFDPA